MPRQVRVEYEGAIYHVMARGDHREKIVHDDEDRRRFEATLGEVLVEENDYLTTLVHYVHLNPVRAKLVRIADGIESYPWCSLVAYTRSPTKRREWLSVEAGLNTTLRRGWCFGSDEFKEKMLEKLGAMMPEEGYKLENGYCGKQLRDHGERAAREWIRVGLDVLGLELTGLAEMRKMDLRKAMLSGLLRRHTSMGLDWISRELHMGVRSSVTRAKKILKQRILDDEDLRKLWEKLEMQQISS